MHWKIAWVLTLILAVSFQVEPAKVPQAWNAKNIEWQKTDPDGTKWAVLEGRSDAPGEAFTYAAFIPAGFHEFHSHPSDARVAVVQGVPKVSFGETSDLEHLKSYPVGSFLFVPANVPHTMAADEDTIIIGTAVGPWHTIIPPTISTTIISQKFISRTTISITSSNYARESRPHFRYDLRL
jgi:quercetin dioxygenase-like cupin family protein